MAGVRGSNFFALRFNRCLVDQHDGDVVFHRIDAAALRAL